MRFVTRRQLVLAAFCGTMSCYNYLPLWEGEVNVAPMERASIAKCGTGALTDLGSKRITRTPYLQSTTTTSTVIAWGSVDGKGAVEVREPGGDVVATAPAVYMGDKDRGAERLREQHEPGEELDADDIYVVGAGFTKLKPTHLYCYQLVDKGQPLTELAPFTTAAAADVTDATRFVVLGDSGTGGAAQVGIMKRISANPFEFMLFLGDIAYASGSATQLQTKFFDIYQDFMKYVPVYPTIGNHERRTRKGDPYFEAFVLPGEERYYSFDWGSVHFVAIDTTHRDKEQIIWLDEDLEKNKLPWVIVYGHHPMYTNSMRGPQLSIRRAFAKVLTHHKVDLVVTGHEHHYERFKVADVNYIVSGGGGGQLTRFYGRNEALKQATVHHFLAFEVSPTELKMKAIDIEGNEIESLALRKDGAKTDVKVDGVIDNRETPVAPEKEIVPDEKVHDEPDDDAKKEKAPPTPTPPKDKKKPDPKKTDDKPPTTTQTTAL
jgi:hypothetical protein